MASKVAASVRTVLCKVTPAPTTLSERRAVLRMLKQHGEIDVFKKLHDPSSFISVTGSHTVALNLIARSPLQFEYGHQAASPVPGTAPTDRSAEPTSSNKTFTVGIWEKPDYGHNTRIRESPIYGPWSEYDNLFQQTSIATAALRRAVPQSMAWRGLVDWESRAQLEGQAALPSFLSSKKDFVHARRARQTNRPAFKSLTETHNAAKDAKTEEHGERDAQGDARGPQPINTLRRHSKLHST